MANFYIDKQRLGLHTMLSLYIELCGSRRPPLSGTLVLDRCFLLYNFYTLYYINICVLITIGR